MDRCPEKLEQAGWMRENVGKTGSKDERKGNKRQGKLEKVKSKRKQKMKI